MSCVFCDRRQLSDGDDAFLVHRFPLSDLIVGQHQYFHGYCVLVFREHVVEPMDLSPSDQAQFFKELMASSSALQKAFLPHKMNYACYGNVVPHMHWHLIPRFEHEENRETPPFCLSDQFKNFPVSPHEAKALAQKILPHLNS